MYKGEDLHISERQLEFQQIYIVSRNCENIMIETLIDAYFLEENIGLEACFKIKGRYYIGVVHVNANDELELVLHLAKKREAALYI